MIKFFKKLFRSNKNELFDGDDDLFKNILKTSKGYAEYGCGASTIWVAENSSAHLFSVDTSQEWIDFCIQKVSSERLNIVWVDCGEVGKWGAPLNYKNRNNFISYAKAPWSQAILPDTVLIDGRFRVLCFFVSLKYATEGTKILFDDYINRPHYHIVEEYIKPAQLCGRQSLFIVPSKQSLDFDSIDKMIQKFEYVIQ